MTPEEQVIRANDAKFILNCPLFQEAQRDIEGKLADLRRTVSISATDLHTRIILMDQLWGYLLDYFKQIAQTGQLAQLQLQEAERQRSLLEKGLAIFRTGGRNAL